jgi:UDP-N-acetylmuramyl pentapeptide phosphotransferase/UDP-N-acetylglucosamine-1-phosphate transferase
MESWLEISTLVAVFYLMMIEFMNYILSFVLAAIIAVIGIWSFKKIRLLDKPGTDLKNTRKPVPTIQ